MKKPPVKAAALAVKAAGKPAAPAKPSRFDSIKKMILGGGAPAKGAALAKAHPAPAAKGKKAVTPPPAPAKAVAAAKGAKGAAAKTAVAPALPAKGAKGKAGAVVAAPVVAPAPLTKAPKKGKKGKAAQESTFAGKAAAGTSLADGHGDAVCREVACENLATTAGYCRLHYIKNWKKIKRKDLILREKKLNQYIEELVAKYPDKYIEAIRQDLANDKEFAKVITDLDLDESMDDFEGDSENVEAIIDTIKREYDDEGESF
ncbi:hypothetical protein K2X30_05900 [bacterium]|nr:hypothetical protein [bacterium]